ncbi:CRISPR-associated endoribonuclease Cas6 [Terrilactibacillus laevilacticus]|uniref:CRISPR-associated endoribonuclease Cas6 n=1 Tax=Terrilactibacillus laevilacticus TaxID=1380157 RepID=UPI0015EEF996|nr:CRISPR-associated endoribonuclease Cas6 [Terrilactibacillus laevilacticus]
MRLCILCDLQNEKIPLDYRKKVLSLLKLGLSKTNNSLYNILYGQRSNKQKDFSYSVYLPDPKFTKEIIILKNKRLLINFTTSDTEIGINFYNALINLRKKSVPFSTNNTITPQEINIAKEKQIFNKKIVFKTMSPLVARDHNPETKKDWYFIHDDASWSEILKQNFLFQLKNSSFNIRKVDINNMKIEPLTMKKTVIKLYDVHVTCSLGTFSIEAEPYLLTYLYQTGLGSHRGLGFGMLDIV